MYVCMYQRCREHLESGRSHYRLRLDPDVVIKPKVFAREVKQRIQWRRRYFVTRKNGGSINRGGTDKDLNTLIRSYSLCQQCPRDE